MQRRLFALFPLWLGIACAATTTVEVDAQRPAGERIPRTIYGTFLEPIGHSIYGGLWAQILENPSFEDNLWSVDGIARMVEKEPALSRESRLGLPLPWEPLQLSQGARYEPRWGDAANSARSLLIMGLPDRETGIRQQVYLPVHRTLRYTGWLWIKPLHGSADVQISFRRRNDAGAVLASAAVPARGTEWARYEYALALKPGALKPLEPADFAITVANGDRFLADQVMLFPSDHLQHMDPEMIEMSRALRTPLVRFGGNFTSAYHWRDGIGPLDRRVSMLNLAWGMPEYNHFGTDEFLTFCRLIGARPQICLNLGTGEPREAADWVRYVNGHWDNGKGGLLWELGNELWGTFQTGYPTLPRVGALTRNFAEAVRKVDPRAQLIATGADPDHYAEWNAAQLKEAAGLFDFLSTHFVVGGERLKRKGAPPDFVARAAFALPVQLERQLRAMKEQVDMVEWARGRVRIAFTEWLFHGPNESMPRFNNMGGAICTAGFLNTLLRTASIVPVSDMTGLIEFGGVWKKRGRVYGVPAYWAFRMYSNADADVPLETRTDGETYDVHEGNVRLPEIAAVPYLDVVAARNTAGDRLTLFCVNRNENQDVAAQIRVKGFRPAAASAETLSASSIHAVNSEEDPEAIKPRASKFAPGETFDYTFPKASVTVIRLDSAR